MPLESDEIERKLKHLGEKIRESAEQKHPLTENERDSMRRAVREQWREQQKEAEKRHIRERDRGPEL